MKIAYLHTPIYHPAHGFYAKVIEAEFILLNKYGQYNYKNKFQIFKKIWSWFWLLLKFPYLKYVAILTDEPSLVAILIKKLSFNRIKLIATQGGQTPTKYIDGEYSGFSKRNIQYCYNNYDLIICIGEDICNNVKKICEGNKKIRIAESFNGVEQDRFDRLSQLQYNENSKNIYSIAGCYSLDRITTKGIDLMLEVVSELFEGDKDLKYYIIGDFSDSVLAYLKANFPKLDWDRICFLGAQKDFSPFLKDCSCLFQFSRRDTWGITVSEVACVGIPSFISDKVGARKMLDGLDIANNFIITSEDINEAVEKLKKFLLASPAFKREVSNQFKTISSLYTTGRAGNKFKKQVYNLLKDE